MTSAETYVEKLKDFFRNHETGKISATLEESQAKAQSGTWYFNPMMSKHGSTQKIDYKNILFYRLKEWKTMGVNVGESYVSMTFDRCVKLNGKVLNINQTQSNREYDYHMEAVPYSMVLEFAKNKRGTMLGEDVGIL